MSHHPFRGNFSRRSTALRPFLQPATQGNSTTEYTKGKISVSWSFLLGLVALSLLTAIPHIRGWNEASRLATVQSLVEQGSFQIDESNFAFTGDKVRINGHFYSDKPVFPALLGSLVYWPLYHFLHLQLGTGWNGAYYLILLFTMKFWWIAAVLAFHAMLQHTYLPARPRLGLTVLLALASLFLTWSSTFNNHGLAASFLLIGFYFWIRSRREEHGLGSLLGAGACLAWAGVSDMPMLVFLPGFMILLLARRASLREILMFAAVPVLTLGMVFLINWRISGSILPFQIIPEYFHYPGSPWLDDKGLTGVSGNRPLAAILTGFQLLLGPAGIFWHAPTLPLALMATIITWRNRDPFWREAGVLLISSAVIWIYYAVFSTNLSGWSYSIRWLVPLLPLFTFYLYRAWYRLEGRRRVFWWTLGILSGISAWVGLINPWTNPGYSPVPFFANLLELQHRLLQFL